MDYHQKNKDKFLKKAYEKYYSSGGKEKTIEYYKENKEKIKKRERERYRNMDKFEKNDKIKKILDRYHRLKNEKDNYKDE